MLTYVLEKVVFWHKTVQIDTILKKKKKLIEFPVPSYITQYLNVNAKKIKIAVSKISTVLKGTNYSRVNF